jgi:geranylgeranyl diphosphate synthase, type I
MNISSFKKSSDKILQIYVKKKIREAQKIASWDRPHTLVWYIDNVIFAWWKRIRPYLIYLGYKLYWWLSDAEVIRFSWSAELIHTLALIHDDIIDKGEIRHNQACFHTFAAGIIWWENQKHLWVSQAILAWDLVFARAYDVLYDEYNLPLHTLKWAQKHMQTMIEEVITGQFLDGDCMVWDHVDSKKLEEKNHYKSWQYTFTRPLVTWAILAWVDKKTISQLEKIWSLLGRAYQMRDDILDVTITDGDDTSHYDNKTKFSDIQDGQQTYLTNYIYEKWSYTHRIAITKAMWKRLSSLQISELRQVFINSWAITYGKWLLQEYLLSAKKLIEKLSVVDSSYKVYLYDIIVLLETV